MENTPVFFLKTGFPLPETGLLINHFYFLHENGDADRMNGMVPGVSLKEDRPASEGSRWRFREKKPGKVPLFYE